MRTRPAWIEAEVYFRIVHAPQSGHNDVSVATSRERTVEIAQREGITRARVTQVIRLLRLAREFQEQILTMPKTIRKPEITERRLRPLINGTEEVGQDGPMHP